MTFRSSCSKVHVLGKAPFSATLTRCLKDAAPWGLLLDFYLMHLLVGVL